VCAYDTTAVCHFTQNDDRDILLVFECTIRLLLTPDNIADRIAMVKRDRQIAIEKAN